MNTRMLRSWYNSLECVEIRRKAYDSIEEIIKAFEKNREKSIMDYLDNDGDSNLELNSFIDSDLNDFLKDESYAPNIDIGLLTSENFR